MAGPRHAAPGTRDDGVVAERRPRPPPGPHRLDPVCTYLVNQWDTALDAVAANFQVRAGVHVGVLDDRAVRRWSRQAARRPPGRGRFEELRAAGVAVARGTVRARAGVANRNRQLRNSFFLRRHRGPD